MAKPLPKDKLWRPGMPDLNSAPTPPPNAPKDSRATPVLPPSSPTPAPSEPDGSPSRSQSRGILPGVKQQGESQETEVRLNSGCIFLFSCFLTILFRTCTLGLTHLLLTFQSVGRPTNTKLRSNIPPRETRTKKVVFFIILNTQLT